MLPDPSSDPFNVVEATLGELARLQDENQYLKTLLIEVLRQVKEIEQNLRLILDKDSE